MTELDWLACDDPRTLLVYLRGQIDDRQLRLFIEACITRVLPMPGESAVEGEAGSFTAEAYDTAVRTAADCSNLVAADTGDILHPKGSGDYYAAQAGERKAQCRVLRCISGNPFRPVAFDPAWRTSTVLAMARSIYESRAFHDLPVLADALEDAGCTDESLLGHLRGGGVHVRGCWAVDAILTIK